MPKKIRFTPAELNRRRKRALRLIHEGKSQSDAALLVGVTKQAVSIWVKQYAKGGWRGLRVKRPGAARILSISQVQALKKLIDRGPEKAGYADGMWTAPRINKIIAREFGVQASGATVLNLVRRERWNLPNRRRWTSARRNRSRPAAK